MAAAAAVRVSILLVLAVVSVLVGSSHAQTCASQKFSGNRTYANCSDLGKLGATLHYTYNASNSSLSIAYTAAPATGGAWVAWAINPTATGMIGSQTLMALKLADGSIVAKTYNISGYHSIVEGKLSFEVWDLTAEASNGTITIFGSVKVPKDATSVNQVWQVGGAVNGTTPSIHPFTADNKSSLSVLKLGSSNSTGTPTSAPTPAPAKSAAAPSHRLSGLGLVAMVIGGVMLS